MTQSEQHSPHEVTVEVFAPRQSEPKVFTWPLSWTVGQAAQQAASAFGYQGGSPTLGRGNETFDRNKTLEQEHVHQHEKLELLDLGVASNMLDPVVTRAELALEFPVLQERSTRAGWQVTLDVDKLRLEVRLVQERTGLLYILKGYLDGYKALPPAWEFVDPDTGEEGTAAAYPEPPSPAPGGNALFITPSSQERVICLPCNRLAYGGYKGPHTNWTLANWMQETPRYLRLCDMVNRINVDLQASRGPWGPRKGRQL